MFIYPRQDSKTHLKPEKFRDSLESAANTLQTPSESDLRPLTIDTHRQGERKTINSVQPHRGCCTYFGSLCLIPYQRSVTAASSPHATARSAAPRARRKSASAHSERRSRHQTWHSGKTNQGRLVDWLRALTCGVSTARCPYSAGTTSPKR